MTGGWLKTSQMRFRLDPRPPHAEVFFPAMAIFISFLIEGVNEKYKKTIDINKLTSDTKGLEVFNSRIILSNIRGKHTRGRIAQGTLPNQNLRWYSKCVVSLVGSSRARRALPTVTNTDPTRRYATRYRIRCARCRRSIPKISNLIGGAHGAP